MDRDFASLFQVAWMVLFSFWAVMASAYDADVSKVEVTGRAAILDEQTRKARKHAFEDALYMAALKAGADISSTAITSKGILLRDVVKLDTRGQLVDFNILGEKNTGTHYEVRLQAFFAKKISKVCPKPRYPRVRIMAPRTKVSSNVDIVYTPIADLVAKKVIEGFLDSYSGHIIQSTQKSLSDLKSVASQNVLFDYHSLQSTNVQNKGSTEDLMLNLEVFSKVINRQLESRVKLALVERDGYSKAFHSELLFSNKLPIKTPIRSLNVIMPKGLELTKNDISDALREVKHYMTQLACQPLEAKTIFTAGKLKLGIGSASGIKAGALAYVISGSESWTLLEVSDVKRTSSTLKPVNIMSNPKTLANQTIRFIEGAL